MNICRSWRVIPVPIAVLALVLSSLVSAAVPSASAASSLTLSRTALASGDTVTVTGLGFTPSDSAVFFADFTIAGKTQGVQTATSVAANGNFVTTLTVPDGTARGAYLVHARDLHGHGASHGLDVLPVVTLHAAGSPPTITVAAGRRFFVRGTGFRAGEPVALSAAFPLYNGNSVTVPKSATADKNGNFGDVVFAAPSSAKPGTATLTATGQASKKTATANVAVTYRPSVALSPTVTRPGTATTVTGHGFVPSSKVHVSVTIPRTGTSSITLGQDVTADANGSFSTPITMPADTKPGTYTVTAVDAAGGFQASTRLTASVSPAITLQPGRALPGQTVTISGGGFSAGVPVTVTAVFVLRSGGSKTVTKTAQTNSAGNFTAKVTVPNGTVASTARVTAAGPNGTTSRLLTVGSRSGALSVAPTAVLPGQATTVSGGGFSPGVPVTVTAAVPLYGGGSKTVSATATTNASGRFSASLPIPHNAAAGKVTVTAKGPNTQTTTALQIRHIAAAVAVSPTSAIPGSTITVTGSQYLPGDTVAISAPITLSNGTRQTLATSATTNASGQFRATLQVPANATGGTYTVTAKSTATGRAPVGRFVVAALAPSVVAVPTTAVPGTQITVNGFGFAAGAGVDIMLGTQRLATATVGAAGKFSTKVTIPNLASGSYPLSAVSNAGRKATINLTVNRQVSTHYYFAAFYTGRGYHEYIAFLNPSALAARVTITYQPTTGATRAKTIIVNPHSRFTEDVNADLGTHVSAGAAIAADVPIVAERMVYHGTDGAAVSGTTSPSTIWYFANGNSNKGYREYVAVENPNRGPVQVAVHLFPTHHRAFTVYRTVAPSARTTFKINSFVKDAVGATITANGPVVANRTIFIKRGMTSKIGVRAPQRSWYFAAGPRNTAARNWIGAINPSNSRTYVTLRAYGPLGRQLGTIQQWLRPFARVGYLMNKTAHTTDVAVVLTSSRPIVAEQTTYVGRRHNASTDTFGVPAAAKSWAFSAANTAGGQRDILQLFNPNVEAVPIVVQYMTASGAVHQQTYVVGPLNHQVVDVGRVVPNTELGIVTASNYPFVALNRGFANNDLGSMTSHGIHLP